MEVKRNKMEFIDIELIDSIDSIDELLKEGDALLIEKLKKTIARYGQIKSLVVCENAGRYKCLDGNKVLRCMKELGYKEVHCVNVGQLSEEDEMLLRISVSRDYFLTNYVLIGEMLKTLRKSKKIEEICNYVPFDIRQVEKMISMTEFDWDAFNQTKQIEGQITMFDFIENQQNIPAEISNAIEENFEELIDDDLQEKKIETEQSIEPQIEVEQTEVKDWKDVITEQEPQEPQGFFAELEYELAEPKKEQQEVEEFDDLPWEDEVIVEQKVETERKYPFVYIEDKEYCLLDIYEFQEDITELCKQLASQYLKFKYPGTEIVEFEPAIDVYETHIRIKYIQCISNYKIKFTVRMQNIYQSIVEIYEL